MELNNVKNYKNSIISYINQIDDETENQEIENLLKSINNKLKFNNEGLSVDIIKNRIEYVGLNNITIIKTILRAIKEYNAEFDFINIFNDLNKLPNITDLINNHNIFDVINSKLKESNIILDKDLLDELANFDLSTQSITKGKYEILTQLLFNDIAENNKSTENKKGDINTNTISLEYKLSGARIKGQGTLKSTKNIYKNFKRICLDMVDIVNKEQYKIQEKQSSLLRIYKADELKKDLNLPLLDNSFISYINNSNNFFGSQSNFKSFVNGLKEFHIKDEIINKILALSLLHQLPKDKFALSNKDNGILVNDFIQFVIKQAPIKNGNPNIDGLNNILLVFYLYFYKFTENFDYMILFKICNDKSINGDYIVFNKDVYENFDTLLQYIIDNNIKVGGNYPKLSEKEREWSINIKSVYNKK